MRARWSRSSRAYLGAGVVPDLVRAHHGSIAREQRLEIEDALKAGVFGAPSYVLPSGEIFWGQDRLELLERALKLAA